MQLAFGSAILTLLVVGMIFYRGMVVSGESAQWVSHTHQVLESVQDLVFTLDNPEQQRQVPVLESLTAQKIQRAEMVMNRHRLKGRGVDATRTGPGQGITDGFLAVVGKLQGEEL